MKVLIVGNGGREHALAWKVKQSPLVEHVFVAPGNAGTAAELKVENIAIAVDDISALITFAKQQAIELTIIGPEVPLVAGIVDRFNEVQLKCLGPSAKAAQLEGSKNFSKAFMARHHIPTAVYQTFTDSTKAIAYIRQQSMPIVVKADGLAAGKGVIIATTEELAIAAVKNMLLENRFGKAGHRIIIEEFLKGEEASFIVIADGKTAQPLATSQDHKARDNGDQGPNTGGMGAYSPASIVTPDIHQRVMDEVINPTLKGMAQEGCPYTGFLYAGLMISKTGSIKVLEYNCRFGDPEAQAVLMRLQSDLVELCLGALEKRLHLVNSKWDTRLALGVVLAAGGYPDAYETGKVIKGLPTTTTTTSKIFHASTAQQNKDEIITTGGRVLCACALGNDIKTAQQQAYQLTHQISWDKVYYRDDIGFKAIKPPA